MPLFSQGGATAQARRAHSSRALEGGAGMLKGFWRCPWIGGLTLLWVLAMGRGDRPGPRARERRQGWRAERQTARQRAREGRAGQQGAGWVMEQHLQHPAPAAAAAAAARRAKRASVGRLAACAAARSPAPSPRPRSKRTGLDRQGVLALALYLLYLSSPQLLARASLAIMLLSPARLQ